MDAPLYRLTLLSRLALLALLWCLGCGPPVPAPGEGDAALDVRFEPAAQPGAVANVVRLHIATAQSFDGLALFQGTLSSYYLGKLKSEPLPQALLDRQIPLLSWLANGELVAAPLRSLAAGEYSLASAEGLLASFQVSVALPLLSRVWPPAASRGSPRFAVYCVEAGGALVLPDPPALVLDPKGLSVDVAAGVDVTGSFGDRCLHFGTEVALESEEIALPQAAFGSYAFEPALFGAAAGESVSPLPCAPGEISVGPGCAGAADDRLLVRTPEAELFWTVHTDHGALVQVTHAGAVLTVPGLTPSSQEHVWGSAHDVRGSELAFDLVLTTAAARARPILNEALADALGPEPQSEWVELYNAGTLAVELLQYALEDNGGHTPLPHATLAPKAYALLVRDDFEPNGSDPAPAPGTQLVRVPALGKSGLANSGERLALIDPSGQECSVLPALSGKAGQSLARVRPEAPDDDPQSFVLGAPTPGSANGAAVPAQTP